MDFSTTVLKNMNHCVSKVSSSLSVNKIKLTTGEPISSLSCCGSSSYTLDACHHFPPPALPVMQKVKLGKCRFQKPRFEPPVQQR